ncbi:hypothetical protein Tco_0327578 [Tanacetum coccineum]
MAGYKHTQLKNKSFDDIQKLFDKEMKRVNTFVDMDTKPMEESSKKAEIAQEGSSTRVGTELEKEESTKKQKIDDAQETNQMKEHIKIVPDEEEVAIDAIPLATKSPSICLVNCSKALTGKTWRLCRGRRYSVEESTWKQSVDLEAFLFMWSTLCEGRIVGIKRLLEDFGVTAVNVRVTAAKQYLWDQQAQYAVPKKSNTEPEELNTPYLGSRIRHVLDLRSVETEFPTIVFNDTLTSNETLFCEPTVSSLNDNEINFRISFDESDDEDYTPSVSCIDDLEFFKDFENEFSAIVYNDALTSKSDFSTEPTLCPQHIDKFDLKDETSLSEYDEVEQSVLYLNDLSPFNIVYPDDQKSDKGNDENKIDMMQSSRGNENTNKFLEESHDKIRKVFIMGSFIMGLNVNIVAWNHFVNGIIFNLIKNLYVLFGILFKPKWYYKDGDYARMLRRPWDQRHPYLSYDGLQYTDADIADFEERLGRIYSREIHRAQVLDFEGMHELMRDVLYVRMLMEHRDDGGVMMFTSRAWGRVFETRGPLVRELILEFLSILRFGKVVLDLDTPGTIQF